MWQCNGIREVERAQMLEKWRRLSKQAFFGGMAGGGGRRLGGAMGSVHGSVECGMMLLQSNEIVSKRIVQK